MTDFEKLNEAAQGIAKSKGCMVKVVFEYPPDACIETEPSSAENNVQPLSTAEIGQAMIANDEVAMEFVSTEWRTVTEVVKFLEAFDPDSCPTRQDIYRRGETGKYVMRKMGKGNKWMVSTASVIRSWLAD